MAYRGSLFPPRPHVRREEHDEREDLQAAEEHAQAQQELAQIENQLKDKLLQAAKQ